MKKKVSAFDLKEIQQFFWILPAAPILHFFSDKTLHYDWAWNQHKQSCALLALPLEDGVSVELRIYSIDLNEL